MNWKIEVKPNAEKQYLKLDQKVRKRIKKELKTLEKQDNPLFAPGTRQLTGELKGDYRLRVGKWRILFTPDREKKVLYIYAILPRGEAY